MPENKPASSTTFAVTVAVSVLIGLYITILVAPAEEYTWSLYVTILATTGLFGVVSFTILSLEPYSDILAGLFVASIANVAITIPGLCGLWVETLAYKHTPSIPEFGTLTLQNDIDTDSTSLMLSNKIALPCDFHSCGNITLQIGKDTTETASGNYDGQNVKDLVRGSNPIEHRAGTPVKVMFMRGTLSGDLSEGDSSLTLDSAYGFPNCGTVTVGIGNEVMTGTIDGESSIRDITRAVEGTAAKHKKRDEVRLLHRVKNNNIVYGTAGTGVGLNTIMLMYWLYRRGLLSGSPDLTTPHNNPFRT